MFLLLIRQYGMYYITRLDMGLIPRLA